MLVCYLDDSGKDPQNPITTVAGYIARETAWQPTSRCCRASSPPRASASKKTVHASEQHRPDVAERREAWRSAQTSLDGRLIFLDETWTTTAMTRRYAWADVGGRTIGHAPNGHWKTTTFPCRPHLRGVDCPL